MLMKKGAEKTAKETEGLKMDAKGSVKEISDVVKKLESKIKSVPTDKRIQKTIRIMTRICGVMRFFPSNWLVCPPYVWREEAVIGTN